MKSHTTAALAAIALLGLHGRSASAEAAAESAKGASADDAPTVHSSMDHSSMDHAGHSMPDASDLPREPIPPLTDADRAAAVAPASGHASHENGGVGLVQLERLETWDAGDGAGLLWEAQGWFGGDLDKLWLRTEGERVDDTTDAADVELLYGRSIARWWDLLAGVRQEFEPGDSRSWAALGLVGLAPQKFEIEATAYLGDAGRTALRFEAEYELLLTNRLIAQPLLELNLLGQDDPERALGSGLTGAEIGIRLRYEITRQFAPYFGVVYERAYGETADFKRADGEDVDDTRVVVGVRMWF